MLQRHTFPIYSFQANADVNAKSSMYSLALRARTHTLAWIAEQFLVIIKTVLILIFTSFSNKSFEMFEIQRMQCKTKKVSFNVVKCSIRMHFLFSARCVVRYLWENLYGCMTFILLNSSIISGCTRTSITRLGNLEKIEGKVVNCIDWPTCFCI